MSSHGDVSRIHMPRFDVKPDGASFYTSVRCDGCHWSDRGYGKNRESASREAESLHRVHVKSMASAAPGECPRPEKSDHGLTAWVILGGVLCVLTFVLVAMISSAEGPDGGDGSLTYDEAACNALQGYIKRRDILPSEQRNAIVEYDVHCS